MSGTSISSPRIGESVDGTSMVGEAETYATHAHASIGQLRKYTNDPYGFHLAEVAHLVAKTNDCTEEMIAAAWLHDTLEDVPTVDLQELEVRFGTRVASLVLQLTDVSRATDGNRASRKAKDRDHLASASAEAQTIKLADLLVNADSILRYDRAFARVFLKEMGDLVAVLVDGDTELRDRARAVVKHGRQHVLDL